MTVLLMYDIETNTPKGTRRLQKMAKLCEAFGTRVQRSVFQMTLDPRVLDRVRDQVRSLIDPARDRVLIYHLSESCAGRTESIGTGDIPQKDDVLII